MVRRLANFVTDRTVTSESIAYTSTLDQGFTALMATVDAEQISSRVFQPQSSLGLGISSTSDVCVHNLLSIPWQPSRENWSCLWRWTVPVIPLPALANLQNYSLK